MTRPSKSVRDTRPSMMLQRKRYRITYSCNEFQCIPIELTTISNYCNWPLIVNTCMLHVEFLIKCLVYMYVTGFEKGPTLRKMLN